MLSFLRGNLCYFENTSMVQDETQEGTLTTWTFQHCLSHLNQGIQTEAGIYFYD